MRLNILRGSDMDGSSSASLTYSEYLALDELLAAQHLQSSEQAVEHDEMLFIIIHQVYELWFKQLLHELDHVILLFRNADLARALHTLKRIRTILKVIVGQIDVLETMTPLEFSSFRDRLDKASGLQSYQFREIEFCFGLKNPAVLKRYETQPELQNRLAQRLGQPTLWDAFMELLSKQGFDTPNPPDDPTLRTEPSEKLQRILVEIYKEHPALTQLCEALTDIDEGVQEWRYRHVKMVQRTIGTKPGTGGTAGVDYLKTTLNTQLFPDLWAVRAEL